MSVKERFKVCVAPHLILLKDDHILLHLRQNSEFADGMFSLVVGHMDGGESATQAMIREAREEAGIEIEPQDLSLRCTMHRGFKEGEEYITFILYVVSGKASHAIRNPTSVLSSNSTPFMIFLLTFFFRFERELNVL